MNRFRLFCVGMSFGLVLLLECAPPALPCSMCRGLPGKLQTLREAARVSEFVVVGTLKNPRMVGQEGFTDFTIEQVVQAHPSLGRQNTLTIDQFVPFNPAQPPRYLLFGKLVQGKVTIVQSQALASNAVVDYLKAALPIDDRDRLAVLRFCYTYLDSADPAVANDSFFEFARASDAQIAGLAGKLPPDKLRSLLDNPKTPVERLSLFAYLLGACGTKDDVARLTHLIGKADERNRSALAGLLGGLIELAPAQGWATVQAIIGDPQRPFSDKLAAISTIRFCRVGKPQSRKEIIRAYALVVERGDMADMAIEDLRRWQWWDLTKEILAQYSKPSHSAPLLRGTIIRYGLSCPQPDAVAFVKWLRQTDPTRVTAQQEVIAAETLPKITP